MAALPYAYRTRLGRFRLVEMPLLSPYLGPWLRSAATSYNARKVGEEKELLGGLIEQLPSFAVFCQHFHPRVTNWLPFYWRGFQQTTHYTYILEDLTDIDRVFGNFSHAKKKNIRRARTIVEVRQDMPVERFYDHLVLTLKKQGKTALYSFEVFNRIHEECYRRGAGKTFYAQDSQNNVHAAIFTVSDKQSAYYIVSSIDPDFRNSGAVALVVHEAIRYYSGRTQMFDFCGHMNERIERSSREFGGRQTPCFVVSRTDSVVVRGYRAAWKLTHGHGLRCGARCLDSDGIRDSRSPK